MEKCFYTYIEQEHEDDRPFASEGYYETSCSQDMDEEYFDNIEPTYCPYCGNEIEIIKES